MRIIARSNTHEILLLQEIFNQTILFCSFLGKSFGFLKMASLLHSACWSVCKARQSISRPNTSLGLGLESLKIVFKMKT